MSKSDRILSLEATAVQLDDRISALAHRVNALEALEVMAADPHALAGVVGGLREAVANACRAVGVTPYAVPQEGMDCLVRLIGDLRSTVASQNAQMAELLHPLARLRTALGLPEGATPKDLAGHAEMMLTRVRQALELIKRGSPGNAADVLRSVLGGAK